MDDGSRGKPVLEKPRQQVDRHRGRLRGRHQRDALQFGDLEELALSFNGIKRAYAIQAGREVRILVDTEKVSDERTLVLSKEIARKVQDDVNYPGQICVNVIRESRATGTAR